MATPQNQSVHRTFAILRALQDQTEPASALELAAAAGLSHSTTHRFLASLEKAGAVQRAANGRYRLGLLMHELGRRVDREQLYVDAAIPALKSLAGRFGASAHLGILREGMVAYLVKQAPHRAWPVPTEVNTELEAYCSGVGKVLLAHLPGPALDAYLEDGDFVALTDRTITDPDVLRQELAAVRGQGFAIDNEEVLANLTCIAVPLPDGRGRIDAAISLSGSSAAMHEQGFMESALAALRSTAADISDILFGGR